jgi:hypothetical protein
MKSKNSNSDDVISSLEESKYKPASITTDTDKAFISNMTQKVFDKYEYDIIHSLYRNRQRSPQGVGHHRPIRTDTENNTEQAIHQEKEYE